MSGAIELSLSLTLSKDSTVAKMLKILTRLWVLVVILEAVASHSHHYKNYCKQKCPLFDPPRGAVYLPGPTKNHFYKCNFGVGVLFRCRPGYHFNPRLRVCDRARRAHAVVCRHSPDHEEEGSGEEGSGYHGLFQP